MEDIAFYATLVAGTSLLTFLVTSLYYETKLTNLFMGIYLVTGYFEDFGSDLRRMNPGQLWYLNRGIASLVKDVAVRRGEEVDA